MDQIVRKIQQRPYLAAGLLFLLLALVFLGRVLLPPAGEVLGGYDMRGLFHVLTDTVFGSIKSGTLPLWNPYLFNGFPLLSDPQAATFYPINWLNLLLPVTMGISWYLLAHILIAGFGMFAFVKYRGGEWFPSLLAGVVFAFGGLIAGRLWAGHSIVYAVFAWTPWLLLALSWSVQTESIWASIIAGIPFGLAILGGHLPSFVYVMMIWGAYLLFLLITEKSSRRLVFRQAIIMVITGIGLSAIQLIPTLQLTLLSERAGASDYDFASRFSFPPAHLATLVVPEFFGEPLRVGYWSVPTFEELTYYAGLLGLIALVISFFKADKLTWFYIFLMVFGIAFAMGSYGIVHRVLYEIFPPFRYMRAPARAGFLFFFASAALLGHSLSIWVRSSAEDRDPILRPVLRWLLAAVLVCGVLAIAATGAVFISVHPTDTSGRLWHQIGGYAIALFVVLISGGLLWAYLTKRPSKGWPRLAILTALLAILLLDLWTFSYKFVRTDPIGPDQLWLDAKEIIGETNASVLPWGLSIFTQNGGMQVGLRSVFGYNSLAPGNHLALAASIPDPRSTAYDIIGTEFVISEAPLDQFSEGESGIVFVDESSSVKVYSRPSVLPIARMVHEVEVIPENQEAINRIHDPEFDPATTAILASDEECDIDPTSSTADRVEVVESRPRYWKIDSQSDSNGLIILAENAYPGWEVTIDGERAESLVAY
ncbi:MAG TPA: hypothetical protein VFI27_18150, partial [candidate division Zixibacteria bacterium]|nr:hypothetical protein [candidate division Zixibacteria bacterium]